MVKINEEHVLFVYNSTKLEVVFEYYLGQTTGILILSINATEK